MRLLALLVALVALPLLLAADNPPAVPSAPSAPETKPAAAPAANPAAPAPSAAADKPKLQIIPGKVIVPTDNMRRPWGELISLDLKTRTGTFRNEGNDQVQSFIVMPYSELTHHAAAGDLQDYRVGERAIFRLHPNDKDEWVWLTYIQDEMNFLNGHKEYYYVDSIDAPAGKLNVTDANFDKSYTRAQGIILETDGETRYWKAGQPATFADIHVGDRLRTKTHGAGQGKRRICWEVFLDDESLKKFQDEQREVNRQRMASEGIPGYVDAGQSDHLELTLFGEGSDFFGRLKPGLKVRVAPAGVDRQPTADPIAAVVEASKPAGRTCAVTVKLDSPPAAPFAPAGLARLWIE